MELKRNAVSAALSLSLALAITACSGSATELIVVVDSDLGVPDEIDEIRIVATGPNGQDQTAVARLGGAGGMPLPRTLRMVHESGPLGPVLVVVTGRHAAMDVLERRARVSFVEGKRLVLRMDLLRSCRGAMCAESETCAAGGCRSIDIDASELTPWSGTIDRVDGSTPPTDGCMPATETCNAIDDDCDGNTDEGFDLLTSTDHCGSCDTPCAPSHATGTCVAGVCTLAGCEDGFADCNTMAADGCEASFMDAATCGSCTNACAAPTPLCSSGTCVSMCMGTDTQCGDSCVDTQTSTSHCGGCDQACPDPAHASATCATAMCGMECDATFLDCDSNAATGCESELRDLANCGACGTACDYANATESCITGTCTLGPCAAGFDNCDARPENGCEQPLDTLANCGACGNACSLPHAVAACSAGACVVASCDVGWADCNATPGCETSLSTTSDCGACGNACPVAMPVCIPSGGSFACSMMCASGREMNCGGTCVDTTTSPQHCGTCGNVCPERPQAVATCVSSACSFMCDAGWHDCDTTPTNGCESDLHELTNCGTCGVACTAPFAVTSCSTGTCAIASCLAGHGNCDTLVANGCEADLLTDRRNCGVCGRGCGSMRMCCAGVCVSGTTCP